MKRCAIPAKRYGVYGKQVSATIKSDDLSLDLTDSGK